MSKARRYARLVATMAAIGCGSACAVDYSVNAVNYIDPATGASAVFTQLWGNNNLGQVAGVASMTDPTGFSGVFSFVYDPASGFVRLPPPPSGVANDLAAISINDAGAVSGAYADSTSASAPPEQGFILQGGAYTFFSHAGYPNTQGGRTISNPTGSHPQGLVVGFAYDPLSGVVGSSVGFVYDPVAGAFFDLPTPPSTITIAQGLNVAGQIVGSIHDPAIGGARGFRGILYTPATPGEPLLGGSLVTFQVAGMGTRARGINDHGLLAAAVNDVPGTPATHAYVATASGSGPTGYQLIDIPAANGPQCADGNFPSAFPEGLNNAGQVTGILTDASCNVHGFIATPAYVPNGTTAAGAYTYSVDVVPDVPVFIDPAVAIGYDYEIGKADPRFASVRLPLGIGNNKYVLVVDGRSYDLNAGQLFDFRAHGFEKGVKAFRVACIDPAAMLDPLNALAFPTELTFAAAGRFTGTQMPLAKVRGIDPTMTQAECRKRFLAADRAPGPPAQ